MTYPTYQQKHIVVPAAVHAEIKRQAKAAKEPIWRFLCEKMGIPEPANIPTRWRDR